MYNSFKSRFTVFSLQVATHRDVTCWFVNCGFEASHFVFWPAPSCLFFKPDVDLGVGLTESSSPLRPATPATMHRLDGPAVNQAVSTLRCFFILFYSKWDQNLQNAARLETSDWDHKLLRKMFTDVINQLRVHFSHIFSNFSNQWVALG